LAHWCGVYVAAAGAYNARPAEDAGTDAAADAAAAEDLRRRIVGIPARAGAGLAAKARIVIRFSSTDALGLMDPDRDGAVAWALSHDLVRLFGEARAWAPPQRLPTGRLATTFQGVPQTEAPPAA
jgi:hypothetical protein